MHCNMAYRSLKTKTAIQILRPVNEVFEAIVRWFNSLFHSKKLFYWIVV